MVLPLTIIFLPTIATVKMKLYVEQGNAYFVDNFHFEHSTNSVLALAAAS
jgi:hypothetical protein